MLFHYCSFATFNAVPQHVFVNRLKVLPTWSSMSSSPLCSRAWPFSGRYVLQKVPNMRRWSSSKAYTLRTRKTDVKKAFISPWNRHRVSKRRQHEFDCKRLQILIFLRAVNRVSLETEQNEILTQEKTQVCMSKHVQSSAIEMQYSECATAGRFLCHWWALGAPIWCIFLYQMKASAFAINYDCIRSPQPSPSVHRRHKKDPPPCSQSIAFHLLSTVHALSMLYFFLHHKHGCVQASLI